MKSAKSLILVLALCLFNLCITSGKEKIVSFHEENKFQGKRINIPEINDLGSHDFAPPIHQIPSLEFLINSIEDRIPERGTGTYVPPNEAQEAEWRSIVSQMIEASIQSPPLLPEINLGELDGHYILVEAMDAENSKIYWVLMENTLEAFLDLLEDPLAPQPSVQLGWGTIILDPNADRELFIQIPHPINDSGTPDQGIGIFKETNSRAFLMAGTHRRTSLNCSGTGAQCDDLLDEDDPSFNNCESCNCECGGMAPDDNSERNFRETDVAHEIHTTFHWTVEEFDNIYENFYGPSQAKYYVALQFHGMRSCSGMIDIFLTYGQNEELNPETGGIIYDLRRNLCMNNQSCVQDCEGENEDGEPCDCPCDDCGEGLGYDCVHDGSCVNDGGACESSPCCWEIKLPGEPGLPGEEECDLYGSLNVQGRFLNGLDPNTYDPEETEYSGKFIHIEQAPREYRDASNWIIAIIQTFPPSLFNGPHWTLNSTGSIYRNSNVGIGIGIEHPEGILHIQAESEDEVNLDANSGTLVISNVQDNRTLAIDDNEIMARNGDEPSRLALQAEGGEIRIHNRLPGSSSLVMINEEGNLGLGLRASDINHKLNVKGTFKLQSSNNHTIRIRVDENGDLNILGDAGPDGRGIVLMRINDQNGNVIVHGDLFAEGANAKIKNFKMDYPLKRNTELWYASVEGPEAAAYVRGTTRLKNGQAEVLFPEHFSFVGNHKTMTVILTPLSANSKGLAVIEKKPDGFTVKELLKGKGTYDFDWEVKCVRKGYEDYKVLRKKEE